MSRDEWRDVAHELRRRLDKTYEEHQ
jgi:hypothetical protein